MSANNTSMIFPVQNQILEALRQAVSSATPTRATNTVRVPKAQHEALVAAYEKGRDKWEVQNAATQSAYANRGPQPMCANGGGGIGMPPAMPTDVPAGNTMPPAPGIIGPGCPSHHANETFRDGEELRETPIVGQFYENLARQNDTAFAQVYQHIGDWLKSVRKVGDTYLYEAKPINTGDLDRVITGFQAANGNFLGVEGVYNGVRMKELHDSSPPDIFRM
jgi:hypothetical protein